MIEDEILDIFGEDGQSFNSNGAFTKFNPKTINEQSSQTDRNSLKLLYPDDWGKLPPSTPYIPQSAPKSGDEAHTPWTKRYHVDSKYQIELGTTRFRIDSDGSEQPQNDIHSDPRIVRTSQVHGLGPGIGPSPADIRPEKNPKATIMNGGNMIGTAPTDAEYIIVDLNESDDPWHFRGRVTH